VIILEKVPVCAKCGAKADSSFATHRMALTGTGENYIKRVMLIYCKECGAVQGVVNP
jgi:predicted nucleic-acid-binding Zn-ribbon protein